MQTPLLNREYQDIPLKSAAKATHANQIQPATSRSLDRMRHRRPLDRNQSQFPQLASLQIHQARRHRNSRRPHLDGLAPQSHRIRPAPLPLTPICANTGYATRGTDFGLCARVSRAKIFRAWQKLQRFTCRPHQISPPKILLSPPPTAHPLVRCMPRPAETAPPHA